MSKYITLYDIVLNVACKPTSSTNYNIFGKRKIGKGLGYLSPIYFSKLSQIPFRKTHIVLVKAGEFVPVVFLPRLIPAAEVKHYGVIH